MKQMFTVIILLVSAINLHADDIISQMDKQTKRIDSIACLVHHLEALMQQQRVVNQTFDAKDKLLASTVDSIQNDANQIKQYIKAIENKQSKDRDLFNNNLQDVNENMAINMGKMDLRMICGGILVLTAIIGFSIYLYLKRRKDFASISEVKIAQEALRDAQSKIQEESIKLDNQLLTLVQKQLEVVDTAKTGAAREPDHSLALKVADEIVRIELNLSRMDSSVKGYKQLSKAVERIKNNFMANGYEIVDMLGKNYTSGIKAAVTFVTDESLDDGVQIITKIIKPQINYHQQMIQAAEIEVSQSE